ncbi:hypothetical protein N7470_003374 [Penicillium chermesinum]|nr:hypothetical protein N7470_003374 [Penicillium chermesinum]
MGAAGGVFLRFCGLVIRFLQFLVGVVILGIFSYFLAILSHHNQTIATWVKAVEGLAGATTLYGLLGTIFVCCLGGVAFFAFLGVVFDVPFMGAMIAVAILTRHGVNKCSGIVDTPVGKGNANDDSPSDLRYRTACRLEKAVFAVSIIGIFFFLVSVFFQVLLARHHKREKRFGPSPANGYTSGSRRWFWSKNKNAPDAAGENILLGTLLLMTSSMARSPRMRSRGSVASAARRTMALAPQQPPGPMGMAMEIPPTPVTCK